MQAKHGELTSTRIPDPTDAAVKSAISKAEFSKHCRQRTRDEEKTLKLIEELLLSSGKSMYKLMPSTPLSLVNAMELLDFKETIGERVACMVSAHCLM